MSFLLKPITAYGFHFVTIGLASVFKRALVKLLLTLAREFALTLSVSRDAPDEQVKKALWKVIVRIRPDKPGGPVGRTKTLNDAWSNWQGAQRAPGRPLRHLLMQITKVMLRCAVQKQPAARQGYRVRGSAVMSTYKGSPGIEH